MWDLIKNDWEKLPQSIRYFFIIGAVLVFNSWLLDHWLPSRELPFKYFGLLDIRSLCYHVYPWETAQDLNFISYGTHVEDHFPNPQNSKIKIAKNKILDTTKYQNGGSINTNIDIIKTEKF